MLSDVFDYPNDDLFLRHVSEDVSLCIDGLRQVGLSLEQGRRYRLRLSKRKRVNAVPVYLCVEDYPNDYYINWGVSRNNQVSRGGLFTTAMKNRLQDALNDSGVQLTTKYQVFYLSAEEVE